jgi:hypothetical protein
MAVDTVITSFQGTRIPTQQHPEFDESDVWLQIFHSLEESLESFEFQDSKRGREITNLIRSIFAQTTGSLFTSSLPSELQFFQFFESTIADIVSIIEDLESKELAKKYTGQQATQ